MRKKLVTSPSAAYRRDLELGETNPKPLPPCAVCGRTPVVEWHDGLCGAHSRPLAEHEEPAPRVTRQPDTSRDEPTRRSVLTREEVLKAMDRYGWSFALAANSFGCEPETMRRNVLRLAPKEYAQAQHDGRVRYTRRQAS